MHTVRLEVSSLSRTLRICGYVALLLQAVSCAPEWDPNIHARCDGMHVLAGCSKNISVNICQSTRNTWQVYDEDVLQHKGHADDQQRSHASNAQPPKDLWEWWDMTMLVILIGLAANLLQIELEQHCTSASHLLLLISWEVAQQVVVECDHNLFSGSLP